MYRTRVDTPLIKALTDTSDNKPHLYILTHECVTGSTMRPFNIPVADDVITMYHNNDYEYEEATQTVVFTVTNVYSVVHPISYEMKQPPAKNSYIHLITDIDQTGLNTEVKKDKKFLKNTEWSDRLPLKQFCSYYLFEYEGNFHLIISDREVIPFDPEEDVPNPFENIWKFPL